MTSRQSRGLGWTGALGLLVLAAALDLVLAAVTPDTDTGVWWSVVGLHVGLLTLTSVRRWPALGLAVVGVTVAPLLAAGDPLGASVVAGVGTLAMAVAGARILRSGPGRFLLHSPGDLGRLMVAAASVGLVGVATDAAVTGMQGELVLPGIVVLTGVLSAHALSVLALVPPVLLGGRVPRQGPLWLLAVQVAVLAGTTYVSLATDAAVPLTFLPVAVLVWGAYAFDLATSTGELAVFATVVIVASARGTGPFGTLIADGSLAPDAAAAFTQGFVLAAALVTLPLGIAVHQQERLRARLSADEEQQRRSFEHGPVGMLLLDDDDQGSLHVADLNDAAVRIFDAPREQLVGQPLLDLVRPDARLPPSIDGLLGSEPVWRGRATVVGRPTSRVDLVLSTTGSGGEGPAYSAQLLDVTQELAAIRRVSTAQQLAEATIDTAGCVILVTDPQGVVMRVNAATREITGYDPESLVGKAIWDTPVSPSTRPDLEALLLWPNRSGLPVVRESTISARDGRRLRLIWNSNVVRSDSGRPSYCVVTGVDVTVERASTGLVTHLMQASVSTALIGTDTQGRITVFNSGAEHLLGLSAAEASGRPLADFLDPEEVRRRGGSSPDPASGDATPAFLSFVERLADGAESPALDWTWVTATGARRVVSMTLSPTADDSGRLGYLCVGSDVTERREGHRALSDALDRERSAVERLQALDRARDEFVSTVSHELRTPITSILGFTELLQDGATVAPDPMQLPLLENITRASHRLIAICNDLLLLSGLEAGAVTLTMVQVDLTDCVDNAVEAIRPLLANRDLHVEVVRPCEPVVVRGDQVQLERAVVNLISNAVKFTDDGGSITLAVHADAGEALLSVADTGMGIDPADQEAIFERFFRTEEAQRQAIPGTGLGLSIVTDIVLVHGGRVEVASTPGVGTTFTVRLLLAQTTEVAPALSDPRLGLRAELG